MESGGISEETAQIEKLTNSESFQLWNFQVKILFKAYGLYEIIDGKQKLEDCSKEEEKQLWKKQDAKAQKVIITSIDKKIMMHIMNCNTSAEMNSKLCGIYQKDNEQQKSSLVQEFFNFSFEKGNDISLHISKLENLAYRLRALNQTIDDEMLMSKILSTLPESYRHFRTAWESTPVQDRTVTNLTSRLISEEAMSKNVESEKSLAFSAAGKLCYKCKKPGHVSKFCKTWESAGTSKAVKCYGCGKPGHIATIKVRLVRYVRKIITKKKTATLENVKRPQIKSHLRTKEK